MKPALAVLAVAFLSSTFVLAAEGPQSTTVALVDGVPISSSVLETAVAKKLVRLRAQEYEVQQRALLEIIDQQLLEKAAKAEHLTVAELLTREVDQKIGAITDEQVERAWETAKGPVKDLPKAEALVRMRRMMTDARKMTRKLEFLHDLESSAEVHIALEPPRIKVDDRTPHFTGQLNAPVTIVEFADFECPFCAKSQSVIRDVSLKYNKLVRFVHRDFPLPNHPHAQKASEAASCAGEQGSFWEMYEKLYQNHATLDDVTIGSLAASLRLDRERFDQCLATGRFAAAVAADKALGLSYGVDATPAIFINGRLVADTSLTNVERIIDDELRREGVPLPQPQMLSAQTAPAK